MSEQEYTPTGRNNKAGASEPTQARSIHDLFTFYLNQSHLTEGQPKTVTVDQAAIKMVWNDKKQAEKPEIVLHFRDAKRSLRLNKSQAEQVWLIAGTDDHTKWSGLRLTLTKVPTKRGGKFTIAISKPAEPEPKPEAEKPSQEEILKQLGY